MLLDAATCARLAMASTGAEVKAALGAHEDPQDVIYFNRVSPHCLRPVSLL